MQDNEDPEQQKIILSDCELEKESKEDYVQMRGAKITTVALSLTKIHTLH